MSRLESILKRLERQAGQRVAAIALDLQAEARLNASGRNGGPKVQTGTLRGSIQAVQISLLEWQVGVTGSPNPDSGVRASVYGPYLEWGTRLMPPRPFMRPAVDAVRAKYRRL